MIRGKSAKTYTNICQEEAWLIPLIISSIAAGLPGLMSATIVWKRPICQLAGPMATSSTAQKTTTASTAGAQLPFSAERAAFL